MPGLRNRVVARWTVFACLIVLAGCAVVAFASEGSHGADAAAVLEPREVSNGSSSLSAQLAKESREAAGEDETAEFKQSSAVRWIAKVTGLSLEHAYWLCVVANFAVVVALIFWASKKSLPGLFRARTASIQKAMQEARAASEDARRRLAEIETRLSRLDDEIGQMRRAAEMEARTEEERIRTGTGDEVRKVVESAEQEIAAASKAARRELRIFAADLVVSMAEKQVQVDPKTDQALVRGFARQLSEDGSGGGPQ